MIIKKLNSTVDWKMKKKIMLWLRKNMMKKKVLYHAA